MPSVHFLLYGGPPCSPYFEPGFCYKGSISDDSEQVLLISLFPVTCRPFVDLCLFSITLSLSHLESTWQLPLLPWPHQCTLFLWLNIFTKPRLGHPHVPWAVTWLGAAGAWLPMVEEDLEARLTQPDRVLTDWMQSHHVWAGLIDRLR